ncbi:unnamed protein product [Oncorhynchus mykiss]|uniref:Sm domain-containing protein n=2 Tax=Euteleostomi TaxID=117571 RepID=A0A060YY38_ONCMY|nr:unnamed protein product [Oncorhynchus mykiss]
MLQSVLILVKVKCVFLLQLFYSFFKSLVGKDVVVELKNDLSICGTLHSVDQYLNIKLTDISVTDPEKYPHMVSCPVHTLDNIGLVSQTYSQCIG